jgi:hypothetical protein
MLTQRVPTSAGWREVLAQLEHPSWDVAGLALEVIRCHGHAGRLAAELRLLERAIERGYERDRAVAFPGATQACVRVVRAVLAEMTPRGDARAVAALVDLFKTCPDGSIRARALELLATEPPHAWQRLVVLALDDPSERVQLQALDIVARERWLVTSNRVERLADSARLWVRSRAAEVLVALGHRVTARDYVGAVRRAAGRLSERLDAAGVAPRDLIPGVDATGTNSFDRDRLLRAAENYLDQSAGRAAESRDFQGVLYLLAAFRSGEQRLLLRLWEHEAARTDSDAELVDGALETIARNRLLAALGACRAGDRAAALHELAALPDMLRGASPVSPAVAYARHAAELSSSIWRNTVNSDASPDIQSAHVVLGDLDVRNPSHRDELLQRLDAWCGLAEPMPSGRTRQQSQPMAN